MVKILFYYCVEYLVKDGVQMNPGLAALWEEEIERRNLKNMNVDNLNPPVSQPRSSAVPTSSHAFYKANLSKILRDCSSEMVILYTACKS